MVLALAASTHCAEPAMELCPELQGKQTASFWPPYPGLCELAGQGVGCAEFAGQK